jgi:hypothetical protein
MNLIKLKLILAKILNASFVFFKKNKPVVVKRINNIISINKNLSIRKKSVSYKIYGGYIFFLGN